MKIHGKFAGANRADELQQEGTAVITVDAHHIVQAGGIGRLGRQLKIDEIHMVAQHHVRGLKTFHIDLFYLIVDADQCQFGQEPNQPGKEQGLANGVFCRFVSAGVFVTEGKSSSASNSNSMV